jgi:2-methylcitrate dehydratase PrpD
MHGTDHAVDFILSTTWEDLPPEVQRQSKRCLLDTLGALIAGVQTPVAGVMARFVSEEYPGGEATLLVGGQRASAVGAAAANGFAANALDIDDGYRRIKGHPGACVLPVLLAASEIGGPVSGTAFLSALVVGYEIGIRAGLIRHALYETYHSSGSWGAIAGAAVVGRVLGLDASTLRQALGTAEYHAPIAPMMKGISTPSMGKDSVGWGAMVGMSSVLMAKHGFTGVEPLFSDSSNSEWVLNLGQRYEVLNLYFKPYACCRWAQPAVAGALEIARNNRLSAQDITTIHVRTFEAATRLSRAHPRNTEEAQYNLAYPVAATLIDGELGPRQVLPPRLDDSELLALADRVQAEVEMEYERAFPEKAIADVEVRAGNGRRYTAVRKEAIWEPPDTLPTDAELEAKFHWLASPLLGEERAAAIVRAVQRFEQVADARELIDLCMADHAGGQTVPGAADDTHGRPAESAGRYKG